MTIRFTSSTILAAAMATTASAFMCSAIKPKGSSSTASWMKNCFHTSTCESATSNKHANEETYLFIGDIGGTNSRLAIYATPQEGSKNSLIDKPIFIKEYLNEDYITDASKTFENDIFLLFLNECDILDWKNKDIKLIACFAVAGPVKNNRAIMTNIGEDKSNKMVIELNGSTIEQSNLGLLAKITTCKIVNDFVGQGYGLLDLDLDKEVIELSPNAKQIMDESGPKACVGAGTGLGECFLTTSSLHPDEGYECYPSEGGHVDFVPRDALQVKLLNHLREKFDQHHRVSVERVVSGKGLANVYEFLAKEYPERVHPELHDEFTKAGAMQGRVVGMNANSEKDNVNELCYQAMEIMMSAYGAEVGNCALKFIPTGGLYVSGGLTPKNKKFIVGENSPFMKAFKDKGRMSGLLENVPLFAVMVEDLGLRGARVCAMREYNNLMKNKV